MTTKSVLTTEGGAIRARPSHRGLAGLVLLAVWTVVACVGLNQLLLAQEQSAATLRLSQHQRMLSQRVSMMALRYASSSTAAERVASKGLLTEAVSQMASVNAALRRGRADKVMPRPESADLIDPVSLDRRVEDYLSQADTLMQVPSSALRADHPVLLAMFGAAQGPLITDLHTQVDMHEAQAAARAASLGLASRIVGLLTLLLLAAEWVWIFRPMVRRSGLQLAAATQAQQAAVARERRLRRVLHSTRDALLPLDRDGRLTEGVSGHAEAWLPELRLGKPYWEILAPQGGACAQSMAMEFAQLTDAFLPIELILEQMTQRVTVGERSLALDYRIIGEESDPDGYLIVASDVTAQLQAKAEREAALERQTVLMRTLGNRDSFQSFVAEVGSLLERAVDSSAASVVRMRDLHTLKGNFGIYGFSSLATEVHRIEERVREERIDDISGLVAELAVLWEAALSRIEPHIKYREAGLWIAEAEYVQHLDSLQHETPHEHLAEVVRMWRHEPVQRRLEDLGKHARRLADRLGKSVEVSVEAPAGLRLPGRRYAELWSSLVHLIRNAVDHGIEEGWRRVELGKSEVGQLVFRADLQGRELVMTLQDDGGGIDIDRLVARAREAGQAVPEDPLELIFADGLSVREEATELSGRGLGMAAVRAAVQSVGGELTVTTSIGVGTSFHVRIPVAQGEKSAA